MPVEDHSLLTGSEMKRRPSAFIQGKSSSSSPSSHEVALHRGGGKSNNRVAISCNVLFSRPGIDRLNE